MISNFINNQKMVTNNYKLCEIAFWNQNIFSNSSLNISCENKASSTLFSIHCQ